MFLCLLVLIGLLDHHCRLSLVYTHWCQCVKDGGGSAALADTRGESSAWQLALQAASVACAVRPCVKFASSAEEEGGIHDT